MLHKTSTLFALSFIVVILSSCQARQDRAFQTTQEPPVAKVDLPGMEGLQWGMNAADYSAATQSRPVHIEGCSFLRTGILMREPVNLDAIALHFSGSAAQASECAPKVAQHFGALLGPDFRETADGRRTWSKTTAIVIVGIKGGQLLGITYESPRVRADAAK